MNYEKLWETQKAAVQAAIDLYPGEFGLKAFPGGVFRVEPLECFWSELEHAPMLYVYVKNGSVWSSFAKGTPEELRRQTVTSIEGEPPYDIFVRCLPPDYRNRKTR